MLAYIKQLTFLNQPYVYNEIVKLANEVYNIRVKMKPEDLKKCHNTNIEFAVDFKTAEDLMLQYQTMKKTKKEKLWKQ